MKGNAHLCFLLSSQLKVGSLASHLTNHSHVNSSGGSGTKNGVWFEVEGTTNVILSI